MLVILDASGQSSARVKRRLRYYFSQAIQHHPSVLLLDDIEHAMPQVSDAQEQITEEGTASIKKTLGMLKSPFIFLHSLFKFMVEGERMCVCVCVCV